ncbi:MAG: DUF4404 family protein [Chloroflexi bacterium]|nr:MAG: DUF4404 family protein [Chloroflexota bacterium]
MEEQELRKLLEQLQGEIEHTKTVDEKGWELLRHLETDIHALLERSRSEAAQPPPSTIQRLEETINHLEVTHPTLTLTLSKMLETLSNAGI